MLVSSNFGLAVVFLFAVGTALGSFINIPAWRLSRGESVLWPPSRCPSCGYRLAPRDLSRTELGGFAGAVPVLRGGGSLAVPLAELVGGLSLAVPRVVAGPHPRVLFFELAGVLLCCVLALALAGRGVSGEAQRVKSTC